MKTEASGERQTEIARPRSSSTLRIARVAGTVPPTGSEPIQEIATSATWFIRGLRLKLPADLPIIIHDPVFTEAGLGSHAATDLPDQAAVLATAGVPTANTVARQNVVEARLMLQAQF